MNWFVLALGCAFCTACCDSISKRTLQNNDEWVTGAVLVGIASVILLPVFLSQDLKPVSTDLILVLIVLLPLEILGYYFFLSAIRMAPLSLTVPLLAFTPVMTVLTSSALLGETISSGAGVGIGLVTVGAYMLNVDRAGAGLFAPMKALVSEPGPRRMLLVAIIWSVTSALGKKGVLIYGAVPFGIVLLYGLLAFFALCAIIRLRDPMVRLDTSRPVIGFLIAGGALMAMAEVTHFMSLSMAPVAYMISVKRLSMVFGVMIGWLWFREKNVRFRLLGSVIMALGVFFLS